MGSLKQSLIKAQALKYNIKKRGEGCFKPS